MSDDLELAACEPCPVDSGGFNPQTQLPYGLTTRHVQSAMEEFADFLRFVNQQLHSRGTPRLESMLMQANFSSIVGEFLNNAIPKHCITLVRNRYHNGHPDLIPARTYPGDAAQHVSDGIEVKASRYLRGWQGHNPEEVWLMVFVFDCNRPNDQIKGFKPKPFRFLEVVGAQLSKSDWLFAGRSATSRRTITASVTESGFRKMTSNWIYKAADLS